MRKHILTIVFVVTVTLSSSVYGKNIDLKKAKEHVSFYPRSAKYALLIGINEYENLDNLKTCEDNIEKFKSILINNLKFLPDNILFLKGEDATYEGIKNSIEDIRYKMSEKYIGSNIRGLFLFYYSGHGTQILGNTYPELKPKEVKHACLLPYDAEKYAGTEKDSKGRIRPSYDKYIVDQDIVWWIEPMGNDCDKIFILDACYQGTISGRMSAAYMEDFINSSLYTKTVDVVLTASGDEYALEQNMFSDKLFNIINDKSRFSKGEYGIKEIINRLKNEMEGTNQKPTDEIKLTRMDKGEFYIAKLSEGAIEVKLNEIDDKDNWIAVYDTSGHKIKSEKGNSLFHIDSIGREMIIKAGREERVKSGKYNDYYNKKYLWKSQPFKLTPEEYKLKEIDLKKHLLLGYIKIKATNKTGRRVEILGKDELYSDISLMGVKDKDEYKIIKTKEGYNIALNPEIYEGLNVEKEGYSVFTRDKIENVVINSGSEIEISLVFQKDNQYWDKKIKLLEDSTERNGDICSKLGLAYYKKGEKEKRRNYYVRAYNYYLDAINYEPKKILFKKKALEAVEVLWEMSGKRNKKYEEDKVHFEKLLNIKL